MRRLLWPAFIWLLVMIGLTLCARGDVSNPQGNVIVHTPGVPVSGGTRYSVNWGGTDNFQVIRMRSNIPPDPSGTGPVLAELVDNEYPSGSRVPAWPAGSGTFTVPSGQSWLLWYFLHNFGTSTPGGSIGPFGDATTANKIKFTVTNTKDYAVKYVVTDRATGAVIATNEVPSGTINAPWVVNVTGYAGPYDLSMFVPSKLVDGVWEEADLTDGDNIPVTTDVPSHEVDSGADPTEVTPVEPPPSAPQSTTTVSTTIWHQATASTVDADRLDKATYKQGVDKIVDAVTKGTGQIHTDLTNTGGASAPSNITPADIVAIAPPAPHAVPIPTAPTFFAGSFSSTTSITANLPTFSVAGRTWPARTWSFDLTHYSAACTIVRSVCVITLLIGFFLLCVRSARGASADNA